MAQLGRFLHAVLDSAGNAVSGVSVTVYREGATVNDAQSGTSGTTFNVHNNGKIVNGDSVFVNTTTGTTYTVSNMTDTSVDLSGFGGTLSLNDLDRLVPSGTTASLFKDDHGVDADSNPLTTSATGTASAWVEPAAYDVVTSGGGTTTTLFSGIVVNSSIPGGVRYADSFARGSSTGGIQEAIDDMPSGGGIVWLTPNTTYSMGTDIKITIADSIWIRGGGWSSVIQKTGNDSGNGEMILVDATSADVTDVKFSDFTLDGGTTTVTWGLRLDSNGSTSGPKRVDVEHVRFMNLPKVGIQGDVLLHDLTVTRCLFKDCCDATSGANNGTAIGIGSGTAQHTLRPSITNNTFDTIGAVGNTGSGVHAAVLINSGCSGARITNNHLKNMVTGSINAEGITTRDETVTDYVIEGNTLDGIDGKGIHLFEATITQNCGASVTGNTVTDYGRVSADTGIFVTKLRGVSVTGNVTHTGAAASSVGIEINAAESCTVSGNVSHTNTGNTQHGFFISGSKHSITGNISRSNAGSGIRIGACDSSTFTGNLCIDNTQDGIDSASSVVRNNVIAGNCVSGGVNGIELTTSALNNLVTGNLVVGNSGTAIQTLATDVCWNNYTSATALTGSLSFKGADIVAAATIALPDHGNFFDVTGATGITDMTSSWAGRMVTLQFTDGATITEGNNFVMSGNFTAGATDTITFVSDGSNWNEVARSNN